MEPGARPVSYTHLDVYKRQGYNWYDLAMLRLALPVFTALYKEHIALEESMVYPEARRRRQAELHGRDAKS